MPSQGVSGCGGRQRNSRTGGAANGTPRYARTADASSVPARLPDSVTIGSLGIALVAPNAPGIAKASAMHSAIPLPRRIIMLEAPDELFYYARTSSLTQPIAHTRARILSGRYFQQRRRAGHSQA